MKKIAIAFLIWSLIFGFRTARAEWLFNKLPVTDSSYAKTDGSFGAMLQFTDKPEELFKIWNQEGLTVKVDFAEKISLEQEMTAVIIFSNSAADKKGNSNVTAVFAVVDPQGKDIGSNEIEVWVDRPAPAHRNLELSVQHLTVTGTQLGFYTVKASVYDKIAGKLLDLERKFEVVEP